MNNNVNCIHKKVCKYAEPCLHGVENLSCEYCEEPKQEELTLEKAIDFLTETGWISEHDRILTEPKQGEWKPINYDGYADGNPVCDEWECSKCGFEHYGDEDTLTPFCPNCGADMRVKDELNSEIEKSKGKILPDYCDGLLYSITNGDNFIGKEGDET